MAPLPWSASDSQLDKSSCDSCNEQVVNRRLCSNGGIVAKGASTLCLARICRGLGKCGLWFTFLIVVFFGGVYCAQEHPKVGNISHHVAVYKGHIKRICVLGRKAGINFLDLALHFLAGYCVCSIKMWECQEGLAQKARHTGKH